MVRFNWSFKNDKILTDSYSNNINKTIAEKLGTSISSVENRAYRLGLKKDVNFIKDLKSNQLIKLNKTNGRDLTNEVLNKIALKYKTRAEFQKEDSSAYNTAIKRGIIDNICSHMLNINYSIPQLILKNLMDKLLCSNGIYNTRQIIKPYEIDLYYPDFNLGFEYQGKLWHKEEYNQNRDIKKLKKINEKSINIIYIVENNRKYEVDIKNQIINNLILINKICNTNLTRESILECAIDNIFNGLYNKDELILIAKKYESFKLFIIEQKDVYNKLKKLNLHITTTSHMLDRQNKHNKIEAAKKLEKYTTVSDLIKYDYGLYQYIKRNKLNKLLVNLEIKNKRMDMTISEISKIISNYEYKCDFINDNKSIYTYLKKRKLTILFSKLKNCTGFKKLKN